MSKQEEMTNKITFRHKWLLSGICVALAASILFTCFYGTFKKQAINNVENPMESVEYMTYIYQNSYLLYKDLYNKQNRTNASYLDLYMVPVEDCELSRQENFLEKLHELYDQGDVYGTEDGVVSLWDDNIMSAESIEELVQISDLLNNTLLENEGSFNHMNTVFDYLIEDTVTGEVITNLSTPKISVNEQYFFVSFYFDEYGNVSVGSEIRGDDITAIRKNANEVIRNMNLKHLVEERNDFTEYQKYMQITMPKNCKVSFCINSSDYDYGYNQYSAYYNTSAAGIYLLLLVVVLLCGFFAPASLKGKPWNSLRVCRPSIELLLLIAFFVCGFSEWIINLVRWGASGDGVIDLGAFLPGVAVFWAVYMFTWMYLSVFFFASWYVGVCLGECRELGAKEYIKKRWYFYRFFPFVKEKVMGVYDAVSHFDVTKNAHKLILKVVLINAVIVFLISTLWVGGFPVAVIYSIILYVILRKYISDLQKKYSVLLGAVNRIAEGELNVEIKEDLGVFEPFKPQVIRIQNGFKKAVDEEVKSQRMKSELITNVSHDLKTPLTAIITYINLLKEENITDEQRKEYLNTLERKSMRLKVLIEDLFEVSKANSKNVSLNLMDVDLCNLLKQVSFEMTDKMEASKLDVRMNLPTQKVVLSLDSQKTYRIYENLFGNIAKYALMGTRVYIDMVQTQDEVAVIMRNITAEEISVNAEELTERFVRGDASRNTEGSGLGLAIAKSFAELQGGEMEVQVDGDLFKVTTTWKLPAEIKISQSTE